VSIEDIGIQNTNAANVGAAYYDTCGTYISLKNVRLGGFKYGAVLDQSELVDIDLCEIGGQNNGGAGVWIVDGASLTPGASSGFTNRISVKRCQIDQYPTAYGILDDGGAAHVFEDNNYNGGLNHIRVQFAIPVAIRGGEFESASGDCIAIVGVCLASVEGGQFSATSGHAAISGTGGPGTLQVSGSASFSGGAGTSPITGAANFSALLLLSYVNNTGVAFKDGTAGGKDVDLCNPSGSVFGGAVAGNVIANSFVGSVSPANLDADWLRANGSGPPPSGFGLEVTHNGASGAGGTGFISAYDRGASTYQTLQLDAGSIRLLNSGSAKLTVTSTGIDVTGTVKVGGTQVIGAQQAAIANDASGAANQGTVNAILTALRAHGLIG
jgi:hypothetical protein